MMGEMKRVCQQSGRILIIDATPDAGAQTAYNNVEKMRDPSHVTAFTPDQLRQMSTDLGLSVQKSGYYELEMALLPLIRASSPDAAKVAEMNKLFQDDAKDELNRLGFKARWQNGEIYVSFPISVLVLQKSP